MYCYVIRSGQNGIFLSLNILYNLVSCIEYIFCQYGQKYDSICKYEYETKWKKQILKFNDN